MNPAIPNKIDKFFAKTFLLLIPRVVTPNQLTVMRFIMTPFVIYLLLVDEFLSGTILFILAAFTDALDGALARTRNQVTDWGRTYDPVADKLLICTVMLTLLIDNLNIFLALSIILTDLVTGAIAIYQTKVRGKVIQPHLTGKIKMILQSIGLSLLLISLVFNSSPVFLISELILIIAWIFGLISLIIYKSA